MDHIGLSEFALSRSPISSMIKYVHLAFIPLDLEFASGMWHAEPVALLQRSGMRCHRVVPTSEPDVIAYVLPWEFFASSFSACSAFKMCLWKRHVCFMSTGWPTSPEERRPKQNKLVITRLYAASDLSLVLASVLGEYAGL